MGNSEIGTAAFPQKQLEQFPFFCKMTLQPKAKDIICKIELEV